MANWGDIGRDSLLASQWLIQQGRFRSSVSRAYFGLYALVTEQLRLRGHELGMADRDNPGHQQMLAMLEHNLLKNTVVPTVQPRLRQASRRVQKARVVADYGPGLTVDRSQATSALRDVYFVVQHIGGGAAMTETAQDIIYRVQHALRHAEDPAGHRVRVHEAGVRRVEGPLNYWFVPVLIDPEEREMYRIYQLLSDVEESLETQGVEKIFLAPATLEFNPKLGSESHG
jgi:uncharacterized protein (UPF0332 family)